MNVYKREIKQQKRGKVRAIKAILPHLMIFEKDMLTLTKRELTLLDETQPDYTVYLTETAVNKNRWWAMRVVVASQDKNYEVVTALGKTKLWRRMDIAIDFIKETCPRTRTVYVTFSP